MNAIHLWNMHRAAVAFRDSISPANLSAYRPAAARVAELYAQAKAA